jgi:hypothetical protein
VNRDRAHALADRKALLIARAELDRARIALNLQEIRAVVLPRPEPERLDAYRSKAKWALGLAIPLLGRRRLGRWIRVASFALVAYRFAREWHGGSR